MNFATAVIIVIVMASFSLNMQSLARSVSFALKSVFSRSVRSNPQMRFGTKSTSFFYIFGNQVFGGKILISAVCVIYCATTFAINKNPVTILFRLHEETPNILLNRIAKAIEKILRI